MTRLNILLSVLAIALLVAIGIWISNSADARREVKAGETTIATQANSAAGYDETIADKLQEDAAIDRSVAAVHTQRREAKRRDPVYREYLDRPLPADTLRLYRAAGEGAAAEYPGADRADPGDQPAD